MYEALMYSKSNHKIYSFVLLLKFPLDLGMETIRELDREKMKTIKELGSGNFGQVCKAFYEPRQAEVAVKSLKGTFTLFLYDMEKGFR